MDEALVEHPQDHIDRDQGGQDEDRLGRQRLLERLGGALEGAGQAGRRAEAGAGVVDQLGRLAQRHAGRQVEGEGDGRILALVVDRQAGGRIRVDLDELRQGHAAAGRRGIQIDRVEDLGRRLQVRRSFQHHVVAVLLGEVLRHLRLAEQVVDGGVDRRGGDAEPRGRIAVDGQVHRRAAGLLVGADVLQLGDRLQRRQEPGGPGVQLVEIGIRQGVLVLRLAGPAADVDVLRRLQEGLHPHEVLQLRPEARDDLVGVGLAALFAGLQGDEQVGLVGAAVADEHPKAGDVGVLGDGVADQLDLLLRLLERGVLRGQHGPLEEAGVLLGEEARLGRRVEVAGGDHRDGEHRKRDPLVVQHLVQRPGVAVLEPAEALVHRLAEAVGRRSRLAQEAAAEHRRQGEGQHHGDQHRRRQGDGELTHQEAHDPAHEHQGREHRDQRDGDGQDREADLARALHGRFERRLAVLEVLPDVLDHDDGVVDDEADGDAEGHQRQVIQAEVQRQHDRAGPQQRQGDHHAGDQGGAHVQQEQVDHQHHQHDGDQQRRLHVLHRRADGLGAVHQDVDLDPRRDAALEPGERLQDVVDGGDDVGARELADQQQHVLAVLEVGVGVALSGEHPRPDLVVLHPEGGLADIAQPDRGPLAVADDQLVPRPGVQDLVVGVDGQALVRPVDGALGRVGGLRCDRLAHRIEPQAPGRHLARIQHDADRLFLLAADVHLADAGHARDLLGEDDVGVVVDLVERQGVGAQGQDQDRLVGRVGLPHGRLRGQAGGQLGAGGADRGLHLLQVVGDVLAELELDGDVGPTERADRRHLRDAGDQRELPLERGGDVGGHGLGAAAGQGGLHLDGGEVDVGQRRHRQHDVGDDADQQDRDGQKRGRDGPPDEGTGEVQAPAAVFWTWAMRTREPFFRVIWPSITTMSPGWTPEVIIDSSPWVPPTRTARTSAR